jgi:uncharacterized DUF497 family protein
MGYLKFEWDERKNQENIRKHGISFQEATSVFYDDDAIIFDDPDHSIEEERFMILGIIERPKGHLTHAIGIVCHCYREGESIRIISAREATKKERTSYINHLGGVQ